MRSLSTKLTRPWTIAAAWLAVTGARVLDVDTKVQVELAKQQLKDGPGFGIINKDGVSRRLGDNQAPCHFALAHPRTPADHISHADVVWSSAHSISRPAGPNLDARGPAADTPATRAWYEWIASKDSPWRDLELWEHNTDVEYIRTQGWIITNFKGKLPVLYNFLIGQRLAYEFPHHCETWFSWVDKGVHPAVALAWLSVPLEAGRSAYGLGGHSCFEGIICDLKPLIEGKPKYTAQDGLTPAAVIWGQYGGRYCYVTNTTPISKLSWPNFEKIVTKTRTSSGPFAAQYSTKTELDPDSVVAFLLETQKEKYGL